LLIEIFSERTLLRRIPRREFCLVKDAAILFFAGAFPYLAVGKTASLLETHDWAQRQALLISFPVSLLAGVFIELSVKFRKDNQDRNFYFPALYVVSLILPIYLLSSGVSEKLNRLAFDQNLVDYLQKNIQPPPAGMVKIELTKLPTPNPRVYESNYLFYRAYKENRWWTSMRLESDGYPEIPSSLNNQNSEEFVYEWVENPCRTTLSFSSSVSHTKPLDGIFGQHAKRNHINLIKQTSNCEIPSN
jgi:hypothetical protein